MGIESEGRDYWEWRYVIRIGLYLLRWRCMDDYLPYGLMELGVVGLCSCGRDGDYNMGEAFECGGRDHQRKREVKELKCVR